MSLKCELEIPAKVYDSKIQAPSVILSLVAHGPHPPNSLSNTFYLFDCSGIFFK